MSFYITGSANEDLDAVAAALRFSRSGSSSVVRADWYGLVSEVVTRPDLWGPAFDPTTDVRVALAGRVALTVSEWSRSEDLPFAGGLAAKAILSRYLSAPDSLPAWLNGMFGVAVLDGRTRTLQVFTDRMGAYPLFLDESSQDVRICSHTDVLASAAAAAGVLHKPDMVTLAEVLSTGRSVQPYTYYRGIVQMEPGTRYFWNLPSGRPNGTRQEFWRPAYRDHAPPDRYQEELVEEFADAYTAAVRLRTQTRLGSTAILLSGGADSRGALFAMERPESAECITFFDQPNSELATARNLAATAGARHQAWARSAEYYAESLTETVRISGGMWSADDGHQTGFLDRFDDLNIGTLLSGCYADWLFKGISLNRRTVKLLGRGTSVHQIGQFNFENHGRHRRLSASWQAKVEDRLHGEVRGLDLSDYRGNALLVEERRLRPLVREEDQAFRVVSQRALPFDVPFTDNAVLDVYGRMSAVSKLNGIMFKRAIAKVVGPAAASIRDSNNSNRLVAGKAEIATRHILTQLSKKIRHTLNPVRPEPDGSWMDGGQYLSKSTMLIDLWQANAAERELFQDLLGVDPFARAPAQWSGDPRSFFQILTIKEWLRQDSRRLG